MVRNRNTFHFRGWNRNIITPWQKAISAQNLEANHVFLNQVRVTFGGECMICLGYHSDNYDIDIEGWRLSNDRLRYI